MWNQQIGSAAVHFVNQPQAFQQQGIIVNNFPAALLNDFPGKAACGNDFTFFAELPLHAVAHPVNHAGRSAD